MATDCSFLLEFLLFYYRAELVLIVRSGVEMFCRFAAVRAAAVGGSDDALDCFSLGIHLQMPVVSHTFDLSRYHGHQGHHAFARYNRQCSHLVCVANVTTAAIVNQYLRPWTPKHVNHASRRFHGCSFSPPLQWSKTYTRPSSTQLRLVRGIHAIHY